MNRKPLPTRRAGLTVKARIEGTAYYLRFGEYPDGSLGEIWIDAKRQDTSVGGLLMSISRGVSLALQCGASVADVVDMFRGLDFRPQGMVGESETVTFCTSLADWIAQEIMAHYGEQTVQPPAPSQPEPEQVPLPIAAGLTSADALFVEMGGTEKAAGFISAGNPA